MWNTITLYPGYTYQIYDVLVVLGVVCLVAIAAAIFGRMFRAP